MKRWVKRLIKITAALAGVALAVGLCIAGVVIYQGYILYRDAVEAVPLPDKIAQIRAKEDYTRLRELPELYVDAVVAVEDHRFYRHPGIDVVAICRAIWNDIRAGALVEGGSTITQQLAKNLYFTQEKVFSRKAAEVFLAFDLERSYTKDEILELYLNSIYFGSGYHTVRAASRGYFGKEPAALSPGECTMLAGIPNAPSAYDPTKNPELAAERQHQVLEIMVKRGRLTQQEALAIAA